MVLFVKVDLSTASNLSLENINPSDMPLLREPLQNMARDTSVFVFFLHNSLSTHPLKMQKPWKSRMEEKNSSKPQQQ